VDVLRWPGIGRLLRWRYGRVLGQLLLLAAALLIVYDGFSGPQFAPENIATNMVWLHYRGFVMLGLLLAGNLFCMNCPFTLPRSLARQMSIAGRRWPRPLRNKWIAFATLFLFFFLYEWLDLWASPWLTAWVVIIYFLAAFILEAAFTESPFCKYVCPLGTFNYIGSTISPLQITVTSQDVCRTCVGKECVNGSKEAGGGRQTLGCGTELFAPQVRSNLDCTFCLDCARACPHDNVALAARPLLGELRRADAWPRRWDLSLLIWLFTFASLSNAFGMTPPVYATGAWLARLLGTENEALLLLLIFGVLNLLLPLGLALLVAGAGRGLSGMQQPLRVALATVTPALVPLGFAIWLAHYGFHFATGALGIVPALHSFLIDHGILLFGDTPAWQMSNILPFSWLLPLQLLSMVAGFGGSYFVLGSIARREKLSFAAQLPWLLLLLGIAVTAVYLFTLPMEMRGTGFLH
jgi:polyferredoxin